MNTNGIAVSLCTGENRRAIEKINKSANIWLPQEFHHYVQRT